MTLLEKILIFSILSISCNFNTSGEVVYSVNPSSGAVEKLQISGDPYSMNWLLPTDGSQYPWVNQDYGWGLGFMTITDHNGPATVRWSKPDSLTDPNETTYSVGGGVKIKVARALKNGELIEEYTFLNSSDETAVLSDIGIYTPFNDNYPDASTCLTNRANVHIWNGANGAYVNAMRMGGEAPHLGLVVTAGAIKGYEIFERGLDRQNSQQRGVVALKLPDMTLNPGEKKVLEWIVFAHSGNDDFRRKIVAKGCPVINSKAYTYCQGDTARIKISTTDRNGGLVSVGDNTYKPTYDNGGFNVEIPMDTPGTCKVEYKYDNDKVTFAEFMVFPSFEKLIDSRVDFIISRQQMNDKNDPRYGAYMVYDNEGDSIYLNNTRNCNPPDRDEGRERVGMGVMLAKYYQLNPREDVRESLFRYYDFLRNKLQDDNYNTFSTADHKCENRGYNYPWVADFYFQLYKITKDKKYAIDGFNTMQALFRNFGYGFYCIEMPVRLGLDVLKEAGLKAEYEKLKSDYIKTGDVFVANSINYPKSEVNYEQAIVGPAVNFLLQIYQVTGDEKYIQEARKQLPVLEAFNGFQPSFHLNDIAIRHWDDYWFGKSEMFGDTFPHYWSTATGAVFYLYSQITGDPEYLDRARNIVNNNLCLFTTDGRGSCAYVYPEKVDGKPAGFYDGFANDQDWALVYYMLIHHGLL